MFTQKAWGDAEAVGVGAASRLSRDRTREANLLQQTDHEVDAQDWVCPFTVEEVKVGQPVVTVVGHSAVTASSDRQSKQSRVGLEWHWWCRLPKDDSCRPIHFNQQYSEQHDHFQWEPRISNKRLESNPAATNPPLVAAILVVTAARLHDDD